MKIEMMMIGALLFALAFVVGVGIYGEGLSNYNVDVDTDSNFGKMSSNLKTIYDYQDSTKSKIQGGEVTDENAVDEMIAGSYTGIRNNPFAVLGSAANSTMILAKETGYVSAPILAFLITTLSILILFAIIAIIFKFR